MGGDGMLLNFEIGDSPANASQTKFKGGKWRDRARANRNLKDGKKGQLPKFSEPTTIPQTDSSDRPAKRLKLDSASRPPPPHIARNEGASKVHFPTARHGSLNTKPAVGGSSNKNGVTSRLFTANPQSKTDFKNIAASREDSEPASPSNAPLSEQAANFHALGLSRRIAQHLSSKLDMKAPTAIQKSTIPQLTKDDTDAFLQAETGSGKTLSYLLPIVQRIMALSQNEDGTARKGKIHRNSGLFAIILAPTRELCKQIAAVLEKLLGCAPWIVSTTVLGGESKKSEKARIRKGVNILIATPGRLADHLLHTKALDVGTVRWLVLDEGDRLMEMGFEDELRSIVSRMRRSSLSKLNKEGLELDSLPQRRVTVLCSATMKMNVQKLGEISLEDAVHITASKTNSNIDEKTKANNAIFSAPAQLKQTYIVAPAKLRLVTLISFLKDVFARKGSVMKAIIFISCADSVDFHFDLLKGSILEKWKDKDKEGEKENMDGLSSKRNRIPKSSHTATTTATAAYITSPANPSITLIKLHGSLAQPVRTATLQAFAKSKDPAVLFTTDIASRGLDVPAVDLVIEYDAAFAVPDHVHRIGRTARAGCPGKAVLFLQPGCEEGYVTLLKPGNSSSGNSISPLLYDAVLQRGLATPITNYPVTTPAATETAEAEETGEKQSWTMRAESLQLHLEQRLLADGNSALLDSARQAFRSHIRAYATHIKDEREYFDMTQLHLGHTAKAFGLREAPGGIGDGITKRTWMHYKASDTASGKKRSRGTAREGSGGGGGGGDARADDLGDDRRPDAANADAIGRMRAKMKAVMNVASEFNIG